MIVINKFYKMRSVMIERTLSIKNKNKIDIDKTQHKHCCLYRLGASNSNVLQQRYRLQYSI